jgi:hypothetical protein
VLEQAIAVAKARDKLVLIGFRDRLAWAAAAVEWAMVSPSQAHYAGSATRSNRRRELIVGQEMN